MPATDQTMTQMWLSGMPTDCAAGWSSATARSARPIAVFWKNSASPATSTPAMTAAQRSNSLTSMPPSNSDSRMNSGSFGMPRSSG